jgi:FeS assembly SUF system protein
VPTPLDHAEEPRKLSTIEKSMIENDVIEAIRQVFDPEIPVNVYDLGLIYDVSADDFGNVHILMTLTSPMCPVAESLPLEVEDAARGVRGAKDVRVELTWDPPFSVDRISDEVKLMLGLI